MKRIIGLMLLLTMCVSFSACKEIDTPFGALTDNSSEAYADADNNAIMSSLAGIWRCYITTDLYVECVLAEDGLFSMDMLGKGDLDRNWSTGHYKVGDDLLTITALDGDHSGESQSFKYAVEGDMLAIYYDDNGGTRRWEFKKYE